MDFEPLFSSCKAYRRGIAVAMARRHNEAGLKKGPKYIKELAGQDTRESGR
jgi:hypothetical protein